MCIFYRIKQFYWGITSKINKNDIEFIRSILSTEELKLFNKLTIQEQKHSLRIAYDIELFCKENDKIDMNLLIKAALLHDVGKICKKLNLIDKSLIVVLNILFKGKISKFSNNEKVYVYYNHGKIGKKLLKRLGCSKELLYLVENHHNFNICDSLELSILRFYDGKN